MNKTTSKIHNAIREITKAPHEIVSGVMVTGSLDTVANTISVLVSGAERPIKGVLLSPFSGNGDGLLLYPADNSSVIIGSIDGAGEWMLLSASTITKAVVTIENITYIMDDNQVSFANNDVLFTIGNTVYKMNTATESLFALLRDLITYITVLTVPTSGGPSGLPINVADFTNLLTRLNNLLSA